MKKFGLIFAAFGALFMCIGVCLTVVQHLKIANSVPVRAVVLGTDIETHRSSGSNGGSSTTYEPVVHYRYAYDGQEYTGRDVTPMSVSSSYSWARSVVNRFKVGSEVEAYVNPSKPHKAFLIKQPDFLSYIFILFPMIFVCVGVGIIKGSGASARNPPSPIASAQGLYEVRPARPINSRLKVSLLAALLWNGVGILSCGHFFMLAKPPYGNLALIATSVYFAVGIIPIGMAVYYVILGGKVSDARLFVDKPAPVRGEILTASVRQAVRNNVHIQTASLGLICTVITRTRSGSKTRYNTAKEYEEWITCLTDRHASEGDLLEFSGRLSLPADRLASTPPDSKDYPRRTWAVAMNLKIADSPDYNARFPIMLS